MRLFGEAAPASDAAKFSAELAGLPCYLQPPARPRTPPSLHTHTHARTRTHIHLSVLPASQKVLRLHCLLQVVAETHGFYNKLRSGARENSEELSLY